MTLVSTQELNDNMLDNAKVIDATWHFLSNRNAFKEYQKVHIENAIFFDLEKNSNQQKNLPHDHFLPEKKSGKGHFQKWESQIMIKWLFTIIVI